MSFVEVQRWRHKMWDESDVIKFAHNVNWISTHWLNSFKASPEEYDAAFLIVSLTFFICTLSDFFSHFRSMKRDAINQSNDCLSNLYTIYSNEDEKSSWCEFCYFRSNPWRQFIVLLEICCKDTNVHESVENKISHVLLHKGSKCQSCQV